MRTLGTLAWPCACRARRLRDRSQHVAAACEGPLGLAAEPGPGVRPRPAPECRAPERAHGLDMAVERTRARAREAPLRPPDPQQRDREIPPRIGTQKRDRVMPLTEPDPNTVRHLALERLPPRAIETDRAHRHLHRNTAGFVESREACHALSLPGVCGTDWCRPRASVCRFPIGTRRECHLAHRTRVADPARISYEIKDGEPGGRPLEASARGPAVRPIGTRGECQLACPAPPPARILERALHLARDSSGSATRVCSGRPVAAAPQAPRSRARGPAAGGHAGTTSWRPGRRSRGAARRRRRAGSASRSSRS